jgi:glutathione peroxidase
MSIYDLSARRNSGEMQSLRDYAGQVLLIVNTASRCGFTPQYRGLQALQDSYNSRGFSVFAFPCDQFGHQEPGSDVDIRDFCESSFRVTFPLFAKIDVNGPGAHPLFAHLKREKGGLLGRAIKWNFTKFLVGRDGAVLGRFSPPTDPQRIAPRIEAALRVASPAP